MKAWFRFNVRQEIVRRFGVAALKSTVPEDVITNAAHGDALALDMLLQALYPTRRSRKKK